MTERVLWFTNHPAPYRVAAWEVLANHVDLTVAFIGKAHANRPRWTPPSGATFATQYLTPIAASSNSDSAWSGFFSPLDVARLRRRTRPTALVLPAWGDLASLEAALLMGRRVPRVGFYGTSAATRRDSGAIGGMRGRVLRRFDALVTYGTETSQLLVHQDGVNPGRIVTGFNTVDVASLAREVAVHRKAGASAEKPHRYLFVGQLVERKGCELAVDALADERLTGETLTIVGDGPLRSALEERARLRRVSERVVFSGIIPPQHMPEVFASHHTLVMPSRQEVWGLVANEALASGMHAVVSTAAGSALDLKPHAGVFTARPTPHEVARAMAESRDQWAGWIERPEILSIGPDRLAEDVLRGIALAAQR